MLRKTEMSLTLALKLKNEKLMRFKFILAIGQPQQV
jgi:hypothetical protein